MIAIRQFVNDKEKQLELLFGAICLSCSVSITGLIYQNPIVAISGLGINTFASLGTVKLSNRFYRKQTAELRDFHLTQVQTIESEANRQLSEQIEAIQKQTELSIQKRDSEWLSKLAEAKQKLDRATTLLEREKASSGHLEADKLAIKSEMNRLKEQLAAVKTELQALQDSQTGNQLALDQERSRLDIQWSQFASEKASAESALEFERGQIKLEREALEATARQLEAETLQQIAGYQQRIQQLENALIPFLAPKKSEGRNQAEIIADSVIDLLYSKELPTDFDSAWEDGELIQIRVKPKGETTLKDVQSAAEFIERAFHLTKLPDVKNNLGCIQITLNYKPSKDKSAIIEPSDNWFEATLLNSKNGQLRPNHARFVGESESGKSTLVNNAIGITLKHCPDLAVELADPLGDSGESEWNFKANYLNPEDCFNAVQSLSNLVNSRLKEGNRDRSEKLLIVDEIDDLVASYGSALTDLIKHIWKQGRHANCFLWIIGQSPYCKTLQMGIYDLKNAVSFYISSTVSKGLSDMQLTNEREQYWLKQFQLRQDSGSNYVCLVAPKRLPCFLANMPKPGEFAEPQTLSSAVLASLETVSTDSHGEALDETAQTILDLASNGLTVPQIIDSIWQIKPSRSKRYMNCKQIVEELLERV